MHYGKAFNSFRQIIKYRSQSTNFFNSSFLFNSTEVCDQLRTINRLRSSRFELHFSWLSNHWFYRYNEIDFECLYLSNLSNAEVMAVMWPGKRSINVLCTWHSRHIKITHAKDYTRQIGTYRFKLDFCHDLVADRRFSTNSIFGTRICRFCLSVMQYFDDFNPFENYWDPNFDQW